MTALASIGQAHKFNRRAFGSIDTSSALLQLYCTLVGIELALKDEAASMKHQHDVVKLAKLLNDVNVDVAANLLSQELKQLWCTDKEGARLLVPPNNFPYVRYLRHESDFPGDTPQADLEAARDAASTLKKELDRYWKAQKKSGVVP